MGGLLLDRSGVVSAAYNDAADTVSYKERRKDGVGVCASGHVPELDSHFFSTNVDYF